MTNTKEQGQICSKKLTKETVKLRFKILADGVTRSYYLHYYDLSGNRCKEFLGLYVGEAKTPLQKKQVKETLQLAELKKAQKIKDLYSGIAGVTPKESGRMLLKNWFAEYQKTVKDKSASTQKTTKRAFDIVLQFGGGNLTLNDIDKEFLIDYADYLVNDCKKSNGQNLTQNSANHYFQYLGFALKKAFKRGLIVSNPFELLEKEDKITTRPTKREFLLADEVQRLIDSQCGNDQVKRAFLFSCVCGLRLSDIRNLTWGDLKETGNDDVPMFAQIDIQKTGKILPTYLTAEAIYYLPDRGAAADTDHIFKLPVISCIEQDIAVWAKRAGINKHVTFHTARHTFATIALNENVDIYTVSKILGHSNVRTTQIYADVVDSTKRAAMGVFTGMFKH